MTASSHHSQNRRTRYGTNVLYAAVSYATRMHDTPPYRLLFNTCIIPVNVLRMVFGIILVSNVSKYGLLEIWHATRMHSFLFVLEVRGPTEYWYHIYRKRAYLGTSIATRMHSFLFVLEVRGPTKYHTVTCIESERT